MLYTKCALLGGSPAWRRNPYPSGQYFESIGSRFGKDFKTVEALRTNNWSDFFTRPSFDSKKEVPSIHAMRRVIMNDPEPEHA